MKLPFRFLLALFLAATAAQAADTFAGRVTVTTTDDSGRSHALTFAMNGTATRIDIEGGQGSTIFIPSKQQMIILMHERRMYMVMPMNWLQNAAQNAHRGSPAGGAGNGEAAAARNDTDIRMTGKTETIQGFTCNEVLCTNSEGVADIWVAPELGTFMGMTGGGNPFARGRSSAVSAKWEEAFKGKVGFPMRVIARNKSGKETSRMEVTKVQRGGVSDADFAPPAGYQQFQMPNLGGLLQGGGN